MAQLVTPGDLIVDDDHGYLRGHGTYSVEGRLYSSVCGVVERVNKLISVVPLKSRYHGHVGDVIVGRIKEVYHLIYEHLDCRICPDNFDAQKKR